LLITAYYLRQGGYVFIGVSSLVCWQNYGIIT